GEVQSYTCVDGFQGSGLQSSSVLARGDHTLVLVLLVYYAYRFVFPTKEWAFVRDIYRAGNRYFHPQEVVFDGFERIDPGSRSLICMHPHGILTVGWALTSTSATMSHAHVKWLVTEALLRLPFISDFLSWNGCAHASKAYMQARMSRGANLALLPGGFEEASLYQRNAYRIYIRKRTGFIAYALRYGYRVYPAFVFGEEKCYYSLLPDWAWLTAVRLWVNKYRMPAVAFVGKLFLVPGWDQPLITVIGSPVQLPKIENPGQKDVERYHQVYVKALLELFDKHKGAYAEAGASLEVW
ncbi:diacylglycerol acyltransferase 2, partial [Nannochloropsis gaditana CCMP526]|uniref:diacylglycerol acyltransferase 2 n=1 Tax=Nannochloropsis gaditana (strain CCMP526) TaxID=1093141 RepID=UPI00029F6FB4